MNRKNHGTMVGHHIHHQYEKEAATAAAAASSAPRVSSVVIRGGLDARQKIEKASHSRTTGHHPKHGRRGGGGVCRRRRGGGRLSGPPHTGACLRMALCFFGLNRSLKWTGGSISRAVLFPLAESIGAGKLHAVDVFFHTFDLRASRANVRAGERGSTAMGTPAEEAAFFSAAAEKASVAASLPVGAVQLCAFCVSDQDEFDRLTTTATTTSTTAAAAAADDGTDGTRGPS